MEPDSIDAIAKIIINAIETGNVALGVSAGLVALLGGVRWILGKTDVPWLKAVASHPVVLWALPMLLSVGGALVSGLVAGVPISAGLVLKAVLVGLAANGIFNGGKKIAEVSMPKTNVEAAKAIEDSLNGPQKGPNP